MMLNVLKLKARRNYFTSIFTLVSKIHFNKKESIELYCQIYFPRINIYLSKVITQFELNVLKSS